MVRNICGKIVTVQNLKSRLAFDE